MRLSEYILLAVMALIFPFAGAYAAGSQDSSSAPAAVSPEAMIAEADSAYAHSEFERTISLYTEVMKQTGVSASLLFNLGNAYYRSGNEGEARLCLERAKRLDPSDRRISQNIDYLASRIEDANKAEMKGKKGSVAPDAPGFFGRIDRSICENTSSDTWATLGVISFLLLILAMSAYLFGTSVRLKKIGFFSGIVLLILSVVFVVFAEMASAHFSSEDEAVLMQFKATLSAEPEPDAPAVGFPLHRGTKFRVLDSELNAEGETGWYKVELNHNNVGWIPASAVTII